MTDSRTLSVLHVDDDRELLGVTNRVLSADERLDVETTDDPDAAVDALATGRFGCVVGDSMRLSDGEPFVEAARRAAPDTSILLFTGSPWVDVAETARSVDALGVVEKGSPGSFETLREHLGALALGTDAERDEDALAAATAEASGVSDRSVAGAVSTLPLANDWEHVATHDLAGDEELVVTLAAAIDELAADDTRFEPLYYRLDAESLESFLRRSDEGVRVTFGFLDWEFAVTGDGVVAARPRT